jgi:DNA (cytosine-5)-methyltransferase 1
MKQIRVVELFAGVGGFRLGLEASSPIFTTIFASQWEPKTKAQHAATIYRNHWDETEDNYILSNKDIATALDDVPDHDLLVGGFPCQDYSVAQTQAKGIEGKKGVLWWSIQAILERKSPTYVLLENVDRLLKSPTKQRGRDFGIILYSLHKLGYQVTWRVINAAEYGLQQKRRRIFIFATQRNDVKVKNFFNKEFPSKKVKGTKQGTQFAPTDTLLTVSDDFKFPFENSGYMDFNGKITTRKVSPEETPTPITLGSLLVEVEDADSAYYIKDSTKWVYLKGAKKIPRVKPNGDPYFYAEGSMAFPDKLNEPARTILTSEGSINRSSHAVQDPKTKKVRRITPIEAERINGFPDDWTKVDGVPERFRYFAMGNALVVPLITKMGNSILSL